MRRTSSSGVAPCQMYPRKAAPPNPYSCNAGRCSGRMPPSAATRRIDDALRECLSEFVRCIPCSVAGFGDAVENRAEKKVVFRRVRCDLAERVARAAYQSPNPAGISGLRAFRCTPPMPYSPADANDPAKSDEDIVPAAALRSGGRMSASADCGLRRCTRSTPSESRIRIDSASDAANDVSVMTMIRIISAHGAYDSDFRSGLQAGRRPLAAGHDLVGDRNCDSVGSDTLLHQQFGKRRCCVGFDG